MCVCVCMGGVVVVDSLVPLIEFLKESVSEVGEAGRLDQLCPSNHLS